jgi:hypothetical protein
MFQYGRVRAAAKRYVRDKRNEGTEMSGPVSFAVIVSDILQASDPQLVCNAVKRATIRLLFPSFQSSQGVLGRMDYVLWSRNVGNPNATLISSPEIPM